MYQSVVQVIMQDCVMEEVSRASAALVAEKLRIGGKINLWQTIKSAFQ